MSHSTPCAVRRNPTQSTSTQIPAELRDLCAWTSDDDATPVHYASLPAAARPQLVLSPALPYTAVRLPNAHVDGRLTDQAAALLATVNSYAEFRPDGSVVLIVAGPWLPPGEFPGLTSSGSTRMRFGDDHVPSTPSTVAWTIPHADVIWAFHRETSPQTPDYKAAFALARKLKAVDPDPYRFQAVVQWFCKIQERAFSDFFFTRFLPTFDKIRRAGGEDQLATCLDTARRTPYPCRDLGDDYGLFAALCYQLAQCNPERTFFVPREHLNRALGWRSYLVTRFLDHLEEEGLTECVDDTYSFGRGTKPKAKTYRFRGPDIAPVPVPETVAGAAEPDREPVQLVLDEPALDQVVADEPEPVVEPTSAPEYEDDPRYDDPWPFGDDQPSPPPPVLSVSPPSEPVPVEAAPLPVREIWVPPTPHYLASLAAQVQERERREGLAACPPVPVPEPAPCVASVPEPINARDRAKFKLEQAQARLAADRSAAFSF
ncbi:MAG: hypothetical protein P4L85_05375 [Paludisphaera borealis]|uniref:hypothetical protein n=1 Tax=Paludisphaera borealis TaxID=1387353 RepID=UPI002843CCE5|nr:hypothetical protein [Paludisphaera borealis]MDR3618761.1 hypothetical protein [Paludisphaera borealis]